MRAVVCRAAEDLATITEWAAIEDPHPDQIVERVLAVQAGLARAAGLPVECDPEDAAGELTEAGEERIAVMAEPSMGDVEFAVELGTARRALEGYPGGPWWDPTQPETMPAWGKSPVAGAAEELAAMEERRRRETAEHFGIPMLRGKEGPAVVKPEERQDDGPTERKVRRSGVIPGLEARPECVYGTCSTPRECEELGCQYPRPDTWPKGTA